MAFDEDLADRIRELVGGRKGITEKKMFGGPMDFTGRPMKGYVYVAPQGVRTKAALSKWIDRGVNFAKTLT